MFRTLKMEIIRVNGLIEDPTGRNRIVEDIMRQVPPKPIISTVGQPPAKSQRTEYTYSTTACPLTEKKEEKEDTSVDEGVEEDDGLYPEDITLTGMAHLHLHNGRAVRTVDPITGTGVIALTAHIHSLELFNWLIDKVEKYEITLKPIPKHMTDTKTLAIFPVIDCETVVPKPRIVSIEGNIGSGKTALIEAIELESVVKGLTNLSIIPDPTTQLDRFEENGRKLIDLYYAHPQQYGFLFQTIVHTLFSNNMRKSVANSPADSILICERSISSAQHVHTDYLYEKGYISELQRRILTTLFSEEGVGDITTTDLVYLKTLPDFCYGQVKRYDDTGNEIITRAYLNHHERLLTEYYQYWRGESCLQVHGRAICEAPESQEARMERIMKFLHTKKRKATSYLKRYPSTPEVVSVEGNIGSGKTKLLRQLCTAVNTGPRRRDIYVIYDTTSIAEKIYTTEGIISELYYENKKKYAFMYIIAQITVFRSRIKEIIRDCMDIKYILCERSIPSIYALAQTLHSQGHLTALELQVIDELCKDPTLDFLNPKRAFYVDTNPTICLSRIGKRVESDKRSNRRQFQGQRRINLGYLAEYKRFLSASPLIMSVITVNGDSIEHKERDTIILDMLHQLQEL